LTTKIDLPVSASLLRSNSKLGLVSTLINGFALQYI
jgi:hypothetical protein